MTGHNFSESNECKYGCGTKQATLSTRGEKYTAEDGKNKVVFTSNVVVDDADAEVVELGILYITADGYAGNAQEDMKVTLNESGTFTPEGTLRAKQFNKSQYGDLSGYVGATVTINLGTAEENKARTLYAKGYVIVKMKDNSYAIRYAEEVISGTFETFPESN